MKPAQRADMKRRVTAHLQVVAEQAVAEVEKVRGFSSEADRALAVLAAMDAAAALALPLVHLAGEDVG